MRPSSCNSTEKVGNQLAMDAPLKCKSQFLCLRNLLHLPLIPSSSLISLSSPTPTPPCLLVLCNSALSDRRHVGHTVSCSNHSLKQPLGIKYHSMAVWKYDSMAVWKYESMIVWQYGNMRVWKHTYEICVCRVIS